MAELLAEGERSVEKRATDGFVSSTTFTRCATTSDLAPRIEHADPYQLDAQAAQPKRSASDLYWDDVKGRTRRNGDASSSLLLSAILSR